MFGLFGHFGPMPNAPTRPIEWPAWLPEPDRRDLVEAAVSARHAGSPPASIGRVIWERLLARYPAAPLPELYRAVAVLVPDWREAGWMAPAQTAPAAAAAACDAVIAAIGGEGAAPAWGGDPAIIAALLLDGLRQRGFVLANVGVAKGATE